MSPPATPAQSTAGRFATRTALRLHGDIANAIGKAIVSEAYGPGVVLPGEIAFSAREQVSRTAYREALRMLAAKGLVESRPKIGTRICRRERWNLLDPDIVRWFFEDGAPPYYFLRGLFELRQIVEPAAAALAAARRTPSDLAGLAAALRAMQVHGLGQAEGREGDRRFHAGILASTGNEVLGSLSSGITAAVGWTTDFKFRIRRLPRDPVPDHEKVFAAIADADPAAARDAMLDLVGYALQDTLTAMDAEGIRRDQGP